MLSEARNRLLTGSGLAPGWARYCTATGTRSPPLPNWMMPRPSRSGSSAKTSCRLWLSVAKLCHAAQAQRGPLLRSLTSVREPIESGAAILATHLLLAELSERIAAIATLTIDPLMLAEPSERITAIATTIADMLLRA
jgi:hypothetical protein